MTWASMPLGEVDYETGCLTRSSEPLMDWRHCDSEEKAVQACMAKHDDWVCTIRAAIPHTIHEAGGTGGTVVAIFWEEADG